MTDPKNNTSEAKVSAVTSEPLKPDVTILVLGDVNLDTILLTPKKSEEFSDELSRNVSSHHLRIRRPGGALLLRNVIKEAVWYTPPRRDELASPPANTAMQSDAMEGIPDKRPVEIQKTDTDKNASVWDFSCKFDLHKFELEYMSQVNDPDAIRKAGEKRIIVANVNDALHFRIFDSDGTTIAHTSAEKLTLKTSQLEALKDQLQSLEGTDELTRGEKKDKVIDAVTSIVQPHRRWGRLITYYDRDIYDDEKYMQSEGKDEAQNDLIDPDYYVSRMRLSVFPQSLDSADRHVYRFEESSDLGYLYSRSQAGDKKWARSQKSRENLYKHALHNKIYRLIEAQKTNRALIEPSIIVIDDLNLGFREYRTPGFDLQLQKNLQNKDEIQTDGKNLIILASVNDVLHFRIIDGDGNIKKAVEKDAVDDETSLKEQAQQIEVLKKKLKSLWPPHVLTWSEKDWLIPDVTSIVDVDHLLPSTDQDDKGKGEQILSFLRDNPHFDRVSPDGLIVWRMEYPLADGDLWAAIIPKYADRTILIVSGESLREAGIDMRDEDPLEQKAHTLHHLLKHSKMAKKLSQCKRIIMRFNNGVLQYINRGEEEYGITAHYHPLVDGKTMDGSHDLGRMIGYTHVLTAALVRGIACALKYGDGFDLQWMDKVKDEGEIPPKGKNRIIVANVNEVLHFRIFVSDDSDDRPVVVTSGKKLQEELSQNKDLREKREDFEKKLRELKDKLDELKNRLKKFLPSHEFTKSERDKVIDDVTSIIGDNPVKELRRKDKDFEDKLDIYISAGLRLGVALGYRLFEDGFADFGLEKWDELEAELRRKWDAGEAPRPLERVFWEWDQELVENKRLKDRHTIKLRSCYLPPKFIDYTSRRNRQRQPWNRVDGYCADFAKTSVPDTPETAAIAIVLHGVQKISETPCERVYEQMHKESWGGKNRGQLNEDMKIKKDGIDRIKKEVSNRYMPTWAPKTSIFLPYCKFGKIESIDREEIIGLFSIKSLIENYHMHKEWLRPLSIAVFGPPGSGKSYTIRELLSTVDPKAAERPKVEFNLAQFSSVADLEIAFHQAQDQSAGGREPDADDRLRRVRYGVPEPKTGLVAFVLDAHAGRSLQGRREHVPHRPCDLCLRWRNIPHLRRIL